MARSLPTPPLTASSASPCLKLRDELDGLYISKGSHALGHERFFPKARIKILFTDDRIEEVLKCPCPNCQEQRLLYGTRKPAISLTTITGTSFNGHRSGQCAILLFALLVYISYPAMVPSFIDKRLSDQQLESSLHEFTAEHIQQKYCPNQPRRLAEEFHWNKYRFFIPSMKDEAYEEYSSATILPFINEYRLGRSIENGEIVSEGSYGTVFAFEIFDEYRILPEFPEVRRFARKQLHANTSYHTFKAEYDNLLFVKRLRDPHLVRIVKAYKHGDVYNFIFPCAKTNLGIYLRGSDYQPLQYALSVPEHPLWSQFLGIARGLHRVLDFEEPDVSQAAALFGYHLDLKPANILVEDSESLVITDFGQATFKDVGGTTSSKVVGMGGTEAYAPPEIDRNGTIKQNRRYDIWSLGCILLEICSFVVRGSQGVRTLDDTRLVKIPRTNYTDDRFFRHIFSTNTYELKPEIKEWIKLLPQSSPDARCRSFLDDVLLLASQMLDVNVESRLTSKQVCIVFSNILDNFQSNGQEDLETLNRTTQPIFSSFEIGKELMERLQSINYNVAGFWKSGAVHFTYENLLLYIHTLDDQHWTAKTLGNPAELRVVPRYALLDKGSHYFSDTSLYLLPRELALHQTRANGKFSADNFAGNLLLQEFLLGQEVTKSSTLRATCIDLKQQSFLSARFLHRRNSGLSQESKHLEHEASSIQIWRESSYGNIVDTMGLVSPPRTQPPRSLPVGPPPLRIVIFYARSIVMVRITRGIRLKQSPQSVGSSISLLLVPNDESADPSFPISLFRARIEEGARRDERLPSLPQPSLPLSRDALECEEMECPLECNAITLHFNSIADTESFFRSYKRVKKRWSEELKRFEAFQNQVGPEFGYARS